MLNLGRRHGLRPAVVFQDGVGVLDTFHLCLILLRYRFHDSNNDADAHISATNDNAYFEPISRG